MATLGSANLPSEDEEDDDYDPTKDKTGEAGDGLGAHRKSKRRRPGRGAVGTAATGDSGEEEEDATAALLDSDDDGRRNPRKEEMKQKVDSIWNQLSSGGSSAKAGGKEPGSGVAAAGATAPAKAQKKKKKRRSEVPDWMKQLGLAPSGSTARAKPSGEQEAPQEPVASASGTEDRAAAERRAAAAAALKAARAALTTAKVQGVVSVTETQRFAGKDIEVQRELKEGSKELERAQAKAAAPASGLDVVLDTIATKKKVNVLGKSDMDWKGYKKDNEDLHDELEAHKKSAGTYLEKQAFLKKAELTEYERERDQRLAADVRTRGRL